MSTTDLEFFFDPSCPFCWITSKWARVVRDELGIEIRWSYISLQTLNAPYEEGDDFQRWHGGGRRMHRVIASAAETHGQDVVGPLYEAIGTSVWESSGPDPRNGVALAAAMGDKADVPAILDRLGLDPSHAAAVDDDSRDHLFAQGTEEALSRTGEDVGTPIITFDPDGDEPASFFGPVISDVPSAEDSVALYRALETASRIPTFAELKRSARDAPQLPLFGLG